MITGVGNILTGLTENLSMFNFMFFVDKFKLEFKVIKKDVEIKNVKEDLKPINNTSINNKNYVEL